MVANELLASVFQQRRQTYDSSLSEDDAFEVFCADVILNKYDPSIEDIQDRVVDGSQDGGIDSVFIYANRVLIAEDTELSSFKSPVDIELVIIQSKNEANFKEGPVDKISASLPNLLRDYAKTASSQGDLNQSVVEAFGLWDSVVKTLAPEFPTFKVTIWYACKGASVPASASAKAKTLEETVKSFMPKATIQFMFAGSNELYDLAAEQKLIKAELPVKGTPLFGSNSSYIVLSTLSSYGKFIADDKNALRSSFFDANVRDYEGSVDVNKDIAATLAEQKGDIDFWWLNNGVTVLASKAAFSNSVMTLQNPLVVNGLQTSYELNRWMRKGGVDETRLVMVRIIETEDEDVINSVIKATNYQTKVKPHSLRATENIHRKIEVFLAPHDVYYDRRRNFYKNAGKPASRTIGIDKMAQAVTAFYLEEPNVARARPTSLMKDPYYGKIFPAEEPHPLKLYLVAAEALFAVNAFMNKSGYDRIYKNNLRFHTMTALSWKLCGSMSPTPEQVAKVTKKAIEKADIKKVADWVVSQFDLTAKTDAVAKDGTFTASLKSAWPSSGI
ncbi:AIPR family protein [Sphingomonas sp. CD22]|uniref:AIPR family protein n=1 Tax=Sphingomonas sp. CD22 TaxID=3100214 RepID=UPI002AE02905|nr:AIPR family protein [Sphingomonas sp. CD22]MEA1086420.1 AIPR family protein [Sphingomonas sp. CD22]